MVQMLTFFKTRKERKDNAARIYGVMITQARQPVFYQQYGVPDSVAGRFEMVALHGFMVWDRLQQAGEYKQAQALFDHMFRDMERALREMGVGDLSVPRHVKRLMTGFKGRALAYRQALDEGSFPAALARNLYATRDDGPAEDFFQAMTDYVRQNREALARQDIAAIKCGALSFIVMEEQPKEHKTDEKESRADVAA